MSVSQYTPLSVKPTPDGKGLRFNGNQAIVGDNSGGTVGMGFTYSPNRDLWVIVDEIQVQSDNANTDVAKIYSESGAFTDPATWGTEEIAGGPTDKKIDATHFMLYPDNFKPRYLGRFIDGAAQAGSILTCAINPNTNLKQYTFRVAGRMLFYEPGMDVNQ